jgi:hypothetical protein
MANPVPAGSDGSAGTQQQAEWIYEVPKAGAGSAGLEEYQVETSSGEHTGKVMTVLSKEETIYLALETGTPPIKRDLRAIPCAPVGSPREWLQAFPRPFESR